MNEIERVIPAHVQPHRIGGFVTKWEGDVLLAYSHRRRSRMSASAAYVWFLCSGTATVGEIIELVKARFPREAAQAANDVRTALASLRRERLVSLSGAPRASRPLLKVAFANCGLDFPEDDNYWLWMLSHRFDVLLVDLDVDTPDVLFFSDAPAGRVDHSEVDESATLKIFLSRGFIGKVPGDCDFAFVETWPDTKADFEALRIPVWATTADWGPDADQTPNWYSAIRQSRPGRQCEERGQREYFCAVYSGDAARRVDVVDAFAGADDRPVVLPSDWFSRGAGIRALSRCRFVLLFEDPDVPGAAGIRLLLALEAGAIPVYFGDTEVLRDFSPAAFVDGSQFDSISAAVDFVRKLDENEEAYRRFVAAPISEDDRDLLKFAPKRICDAFYRMLFQPAVEDSEPQQLSEGETTGSIPRRPGLTIGMATFDDFDGVYFSVQAIRFYHPEVTEDTEILIIDNNPEGVCADSLRQLAQSVPGCRYIAYDETRSTAVRDLVFREAAAEFALCMDSHVFLEPGAIKRLIDYFQVNPDCGDLLQGPLVSDTLKEALTHFDPEWNSGMFGKWAVDARGQHPENAPFEIPMQGLGVFACRVASWPGFNPRFLGFGGEEGYIHEKFRQQGGRTLCLPFLRWLHRFSRPLGVRYENRWDDRFRNYYIGFTELGLDTQPVVDHFAERVSPGFATAARKRVEAELENPFSFFDAIYCINAIGSTGRWKNAMAQFQAMEIDHRVVRFPAVETSESHHIGCALSHRSIVERAQRRGYQNVLVFEDDVVFLRRARWYLSRALEELEGREWKLLYLGGHRWGKHFDMVDGCSSLMRPSILTCTQSIAYNHSVYDQILRDLPDSIEAMRDWIKIHRGIDQFLVSYDLRFVTAPSVATQPSILGQEARAYRGEFMIPAGG